MHGRARTTDGRRLRSAALACLLVLGGCQNAPEHQDGSGSGSGARPGSDSYVHDGQRYRVLATAAGYRQRGKVTHYVQEYQGLPTASGEPYDPARMTAAHRTLPLGSQVRVTNLATGHVVVVRITDRGPFRDDRLIGLSWAAARELGTLGEPAEVEVTGLASAVPGPAPALASGAADTPIPSTRRSAPAAPAALPSPGHHSVQAGAFRDPGNAERLRERLAEADLGRVRIAAAGTAGDDGWYRVLLGPYTTRSAADRAAAALRPWGVHDPVIVTY